jgi:hypothetical protein
MHPKTSEGEDIDFVYQCESLYASQGIHTIVAVLKAKVSHPLWKNGGVC